MITLMHNSGSTISNAYVSNYVNANKVIFIDDVGTEVEFNVDEMNGSLTSYAGSVPCETDNSRTSPIRGEAEIVELSLSSIDFDQSILVRLWAFPELLNPSGAQLIVQYGSLIDTSADSEYLLIHDTDYPSNFTIIQDSVMLAGKMFFDVIEVNLNNMGFDDPSLEIKYTALQGIIYIKDKTNNRTLIYDRKE